MNTRNCVQVVDTSIIRNRAYSDIRKIIKNINESLKLS